MSLKIETQRLNDLFLVYNQTSLPLFKTILKYKIEILYKLDRMGLLWMREKHVITLDSFRFSSVFY